MLNPIMLSLHKLVHRFPSNVNGFSRQVFSLRALCTVQSTSLNGQYQQFKPFADIPGPTLLPVFGHLHRLLLTSKPLGKRILELQLHDIQKYGAISKEMIPGREFLKISEPSDVAIVLRCEAKYPKRFEIPLFDFYREARGKTPGVFFLNGHEWHRHRSVISKRLLRPKEVAEYAPIFNDIASDLVVRLRNIRNDDCEVLYLDRELFRWSFESVAFVVLDKRLGAIGGTRINEQAEEFISAVGSLLESFATTLLLPHWFYKYIYETKSFKTFVESFDQMYFYAEHFIAEKIKELENQGGGLEVSEESEGERVGFMRFLLSSKKLTKEDLLASVIDLLFAGVDTTANTMQWALYLLGKHPMKQEKLRQEVISVLGDHQQATPHTLSKMPYLKAWVKETLRLYPVVFSLARMPPENLVLSGYRVPAGTQIDIGFFAMGRNEHLFDDPDSFKPERWLRDTEQSMSEIMDPFASLPFGFGQRMCIGRRLAELELYLLLARIVQEFSIEHPDDENIEPVLIGTIKPDRPVRIQFRDRY